MINFFRKIRKTLLAENKFTRYVIYAVGEIVLVVIGILIASQINNGNENRKHEQSMKIALQFIDAKSKSSFAFARRSDHRAIDGKILV